MSETPSTLECEVMKMISELDDAMRGELVSDLWWNDCGLIKLRLVSALNAEGERITQEMHAEARRLLVCRPKRFMEAEA